jgi:cyclopropane-fatty-acyl-phospholipid synthase
MADQARAAGFRYEPVLEFGTSYARTLSEWRTRFEAAWPEIEALGFDDRFRRKWRYYLAYCEAGFLEGSIDVGLYRLTRG